MPGFKTILKNRNFVLYSIGQAFSQFGDRLVQIILIGFVYKRWPGSAFQLAKIFFFTVLPSFFVSPIAGVYVDRWNKKYVMVISDMFRAVMTLFIPIFFIYNKSVAPIYFIVFLIFAAACFFLPARLSVIPSLVRAEEILLANSAATITWVASGIVGFGLGGILAEWIGVRNSLYINSLVYFCSAASFLFLPYSAKIKNLVKKSFLQDLKIGLVTLFFDKRIRFAAYTFFIFASLVGAAYAVLVVFIQETLNTMTKYIGLFSVCMFLGGLIGSYAYGKMGGGFSRAKTIFLSIFFIGLFLIIFVVGLKMMRLLWLGGVFAFLVGLFASPILTAANTIVHETIESNLRGRIFSSLGIIMNIGFILFMFLSSILAGYMDRFWILIGCGSILMVLGLIGSASIPRGLLKDFNFSP